VKVINAVGQTMNLTLMCETAATFRKELLSPSCKKSRSKYQKLLILCYKVDPSVWRALKLDGIKLTAPQSRAKLISAANLEKREIHTTKAIKMSAEKKMELSFSR
jgi:hypothetical protein